MFIALTPNKNLSQFGRADMHDAWNQSHFVSARPNCDVGAKRSSAINIAPLTGCTSHSASETNREFGFAKVFEPAKQA